MGRIKTFTDGGTLLPGDLNSIQDDYETSFSAWKETGLSAFYSFGSSAVLGTYQMFPNSTLFGGIGSGLAVASTDGYTCVFHFDSNDYFSSPRTVKMRVRATLLTNGTASGVNFTAKLGFGVNTVGSGAAQSRISPSGGYVSSLNSLFTTPAANSRLQSVTSEINAISADYCIFACDVSGTMAANSVATIKARIQVRQI